MKWINENNKLVCCRIKNRVYTGELLKKIKKLCVLEFIKWNYEGVSLSIRIEDSYAARYVSTVDKISRKCQ